ncbi:MAG: SH3 domain-containing protein [Clostridia bacterium]|nr:SH3 domain-containing protein [Clostridia bacterium]
MTKKIVSIILMICMTFTMLLFADAETVKLAHKSGSITLRKGPGTKYGAAGYLKDGDSITVTSAGSIWSKVKTSDSKEGYIKNLYISGNGSEYASGTTYTGSKSAKIKCSGSANLRAGASMSSAIITTLKNGASIKILGTNGEFYLVEKGGTQGFVHKSLVSTSSGGSGGGGSTSTYARVTASALVLRAGKSKDTKKLGSAPKGAKVKVLSSASSWWHVTYNGKTGYMYGGYLKKI